MKKKKQNNKDQRELFDTKKFERTYLLPQTWYELLSNSDEEFLNELLFYEKDKYVTSVINDNFNINQPFEQSYLYLNLSSNHQFSYV